MDDLKVKLLLIYTVILSINATDPAAVNRNEVQPIGNVWKEYVAKENGYHKISALHPTLYPPPPGVLIEMEVSIKGPSDGHIMFSEVENPDYSTTKIYEFVVGAGVNSRTDIRFLKGDKIMNTAVTLNILSPDHYTHFRIFIYKDGKMELYKAGKKEAIVSYVDQNQLDMKYFGFGAWTNYVNSFNYTYKMAANPYFTYEPQDVNATEGESAEIRCEAKVKPQPEIKWTHNGKPIEDSPTNDRRTVTSNKITFQNLKVEDTGNYGCNATNALGNVYKEVHVNVQTKPSFTYEPQDVDATEGESAEISCEAKGMPQPEIKWTHNGKPIEDSPRNDRRTVTSNKITIQNLKVEDTGNYGCNATNALGNVYKEVRVYVQTKPSFTYEPQDVDATEGESAEISCEAKGMPQPEIKWTHNGKPIEDSPTNDRRTVTSNKITFQNLKVEDTGNYGCNATNALGNVYKEVRVYVQTKPSFTYEPQDVDATEGESAEISCEAKGMPQPEIKWTHNGKPIEDSPTNDRRTVTSNKITFQNLKVEDTGNYGCNATNALGNVYKEVRVYVQTKPSFTYEPQDVDATEGESAEISCEAKGMPQPEIKWTHNGKPIEDSPRNDRRTVTSNKIIFQNLKVEDTGNYGCNATNALGNVYKEVRVYVQTIPSFTYEPQDVDATEGESAEISCEAKGMPQPEIKWTHNGKPIEDSPRNDRRTVTSNKIIFQNLKVKDTGNYGCNATNALGNVYKEVRVYVQTKPSFTYEPQDVDATEGESAEISCEAKGMPQPEIKWTHNGKPIEDSPTNDRRTVTSNKITFQNLKVEDTGNYGCNATNALGNVYKEVRVNVQITFGWSEVMKDREHFFTIPRTASEAGEYGFRVVSEIKDELGLQARCLDGDLRVCPLYDTAGSVAGLHIAIPACHLQGIPTDLATKLKLKSINGTRYWTATQYVVSPDIIKAGGRQSLLSTVSKGIWLRTGDQITELPIKEEELAGTAFRKQNCIPNMGTHYYKNISTEANCSDLFPFFLLVKEGQIIGTGFQIFGETKQDGLRPWFEKPSSKIRNAALPNAPTCMGSWVKDYGLITLHIYYVEKPWNIRCEDIDSAQPISLWDKLSLNTLRYASIGIDEAKISTGRILHPNNS